MLVDVRDTVEVACQTGAVQPRYPAADGDCCADAVTAAVSCACDSMNCWKNSYVIGDAGAMFELRTIGMTCTLFSPIDQWGCGQYASNAEDREGLRCHRRQSHRLHPARPGRGHPAHGRGRILTFHVRVIVDGDDVLRLRGRGADQDIHQSRIEGHPVDRKSTRLNS